MTKDYSYSDYVGDPFRATHALGDLLGRGALRLFLGAGASCGFGLPDWKTLIARVTKRDTDSAFVAGLKDKDTMELGRLVNKVDDGSESYIDLVRASLYRDASPDLLVQLQQSRLLLAIGALMTGSCRGRIESVVTYNYDDLLEQYLWMLGYSACRRVRPSDLSTRSDVVVDYVHGCVPQQKKTGDGAPQIVLSAQSFIERRADIDEGWPASVIAGLMSKIGLFVGLSGNDTTMIEQITRAKNKGFTTRLDDYNAYWLLTPDAFDRNGEMILKAGSCPIRLDKDVIPDLLLAVCRHAAA